MPGPTWTAEGTNFSVFSRSARRVELLLYQASDSREPVQIVDLDPNTNRSYFFWHVFVEGLPPGAYYTWRIDGKELVDPWARVVTDSNWNRGKAIRSAGNSIRAMVTTDYQLPIRLSRRSRRLFRLKMNIPLLYRRGRCSHAQWRFSRAALLMSNLARETA